MNTNPHDAAIKLLEAQGFYDAARFLRGAAVHTEPTKHEGVPMPLGVFVATSEQKTELKQVGTLLGIPYYENPDMKTPPLVFGSMSKYANVPVVIERESDG